MSKTLAMMSVTLSKLSRTKRRKERRGRRIKQMNKRPLNRKHKRKVSLIDSDIISWQVMICMMTQRTIVKMKASKNIKSADTILFILERC